MAERGLAMKQKMVTHEPFDVLVGGGGPAGFAAALTAARAGARVALVEAGGALGGTWSLSFLVAASDWRRKTALMAEFEARLETLTGRPLRRDRSGLHPAVEGSFAVAPEWVKVAMEAMLFEAGVHLRLHTRICGVRKTAGGRRLTAVDTESRSGRERWPARVFIDATGDGDLGALAGCGFDLGRPGNGQTQPLSLHALVTGLRDEEVLPYCLGQPPEATIARRRLADDLAAAGFTASYANPTLTCLGPGLFFLGLHHAYGASALDAEAVTRATVAGRAELAAAVVALRSLGGRWRDIELAATSGLIGIREGRRLHAHYTVTRDDLVAGRRHDDAVCRVLFPVDVHATDPKHGKGYGNEGVAAQPYDIPLRALIARDVDNLALAGRCIGGDFVAHASYRVVGNCVATGEAAGALAALAAQTRCGLSELPFAEVKKWLSDVG